MNVQFATANKDEARKHIVAALGEEYAGKMEDLIKYLILKVQEGVIRVGDPIMYGNSSPIYPTDKATADDKDELRRKYVEAVEKL